MAKLVVEEQKDFALLPVDSILLLKVDEMKEIELQGTHGPWTKLEIKFKILGIQAVGDGGDPGIYEDMIAGPIWGSVPMRLTDSPDNKLRQWAEAILGVQLGVGFELDTDLFAGRTVRGITSQYKKKQPDAQGNPIWKHQIDALLMAGSAPAPQQQPQQQFQQPQAQAQNGYQQAVQAQQPQQQQYVAPPVNDPWGAQQQYQQPPANDPWATPVGGDTEPPF